MSPRARTMSSLIAVAALLVGVPSLLLAVSYGRFDSWWPFAGWQLLSTESAPGAWLTELVIRSALVAAWFVLGWMAVGLVTEVAFQFRHGMPSTPRHDWAGSRVVRRVAAGLLAVVPVHQLVPPLEAVALPPGSAIEPAVAPTTSSPPAASEVMVVAPGDSIWSIAAAHASGRDVADVAAEILRLNLGRTMVDGEVFSTPALIHPGWELELPGAPAGPALGAARDGHVVMAGQSYWSIAEDLLPGASADEVAVTARQLVDLNADRLAHDDPTMLFPGDVLVLGASAPVDGPPDRSVPPTTPKTPVAPSGPQSVSADVDRRPAERRPPTGEVLDGPAGATEADPASRPAGLAVLAVGLLGLVAARRMSALRASRPGLRPIVADPAAVAVEQRLRRLADHELVARVDLVVRVLASSPGSPAVLAVVAAADGAMRIWGDTAFADLPIGHGVDGGMVVPANVSTEVLLERLEGVPASSPAPALVHLGDGPEGAVFADLERLGSLSLELPGPDVVAVATHLASSLASSPFASAVDVRAVGLDAPLLQELRVECSSADEAVRDLVRHSDSVAASLNGRSLDAVRNLSGGDSWEPFVVVSAEHLEPLPPLVATCVVAPGGDGPWCLSGDRSLAVLHPLGIALVPAVVDAPQALELADLVAAADELIAADVSATTATLPPDAHHDFLVRTFGQVEVVDASGRAVRFEKQKSLELLVWMALHRRRSTRSAARDALWTVAVRDATFSNVVSDARRSLARAVSPPDGEEWIARTLTDDLVLHAGVVCDVDLLAALTESARRLPIGAAIDSLRRGLDLVAGLPFAGTAYTWTDAEGITSAGVLAATTAACELAERCLQVGDIEGVFWATGQGLQVLPGHEELIAYRMRAHAAAGDRAGVRAEWESYERAVLADPWSDGSVAPKLVSLRTELLAPLGSAR